MINQDKKTKELVKELVKIIRRDLTIDWANNEIIKARIRDNIRLLLLKNQFPHQEVEKITDSIFQQAFYLYRDYVPSLVR